MDPRAVVIYGKSPVHIMDLAQASINNISRKPHAVTPKLHDAQVRLSKSRKSSIKESKNNNACGRIITFSVYLTAMKN